MTNNDQRPCKRCKNPAKKTQRFILVNGRRTSRPVDVVRDYRTRNAPIPEGENGDADGDDDGDDGGPITERSTTDSPSTGITAIDRPVTGISHYWPPPGTWVPGYGCCNPWTPPLPVWSVSNCYIQNPAPRVKRGVLEEIFSLAFSPVPHIADRLQNGGK